MRIACIPAVSALFAPLFLIACAGPRMVPPKEVADGTVLEVKNRSKAAGSFVNEAFELGAFKVADVDRNATKSSSFGISNYNSENTTAGYSYALQGGKESWKGACALSRNEKGFAKGGFSFSKTRSNLLCECTSGAQSARLELKAGDDGNYSGVFSPAGQSYDIVQVKTTDKKYYGSDPAGYRFDGTDGARGAVETLKPGRIWYTSKLSETEREPATCVLAGLMLYLEPTEK